MSYNSITELAGGKIFALHNTFPLDGRVSAYPLGARGHAASNCYLLYENDGALLLDTGYAAHEGTILRQLGSIIDSKMPLSLFPLRINEFMSVGNAMAIAKRFNVVECHSPVPDVECWLEFETVDSDGKNKDMPTLATTLFDPSKKYRVGKSGNRPFAVFHAPIRLISTRWIYDETTRTLFSSDMFTHVRQDDASGPWLVEDDDGVTTTALVRSFLLNTRYWWLEGAETESLRRGVAGVFDRFDIETIAPGYGTILRGRALAERQFSVLDDVLRNLDREVVKPQYIPRGMER
jgi:hypothetical protein